MRIIAISDTHAMHERVQFPPYQDGDILVHAGDITGRGELETVARFGYWLQGLPYQHMVIIAGNHDFCFERDRDRAKTALCIDPRIHYLMDESIVIAGKKFYGSPWQPWFYNWAFNVERGPLIAEKWALIPDDTDVLITHGPAFAPPGLNYGGIVARGEDVGCKDLSARIFDIKPQYHICGHIHESYCAYREEAIGTTFVNASSCDLHYRLTRAPWILPL